MSELPAADPVRPAPVGFGAWDAREIGRPGLIRLGETLWSFYSGCDVRFEWQIGAAISADFVTWDRVGDDPLICPPATRVSGGGWHGYLDPCPVARSDGSLELVAWAVSNESGSAIVRFSSRDAVDWAGPEVMLVSPGWDGTAVVTYRSPWLVAPAEPGPDGPPGRTDSLFVTRASTMGDGSRASGINRFDRAKSGAWLETAIHLADPAGDEMDHPCVLMDAAGGWRIWTSAFRDSAWRILTAHSEDGLVWSPLEPAIVGDARSPYQTAGVFAPAVVAVPGGMLMLHLASSSSSDGMSVSVFAKHSVDGEAWQPLSEQPVFTPRPGVPVRPW